MRTEATAIRLPAGELLTELGMSVDPELLDRALTHRSYAYEQGGLPTNERLEFLGDSVLGLVVTEHLFVTYPDLSEGQLAKLRAAVVNSRALADVARQLDLGAVIHLGRGEESTGGRDKSSILADTMEAVIGAVFLQHGVEAARGFVHHLFDPLMAEVATRGAGLDWKTSLQEIASMTGLGVPVYDVVESGPDHAKTFQATVKIDDQSYGPGAGRRSDHASMSERRSRQRRNRKKAIARKNAMLRRALAVAREFSSERSTIASETSATSASPRRNRFSQRLLTTCPS